MREELVLRVFNWNSKRYDRIYDEQLTLNLLFEEWQEWIESTKEVDLLDALMDTAYVAYGAIWKLGLQPNVQQAAGIVDAILEIAGIEPGYIVPCYAKVLQGNCSDLIDNATALLIIVMLCEAQAMNMGLTHDEVEKAFEVVCDSNDSKTIKKTDPKVKANIDKGNFFVAPEPRLQLILDNRKEQAWNTQQ